MQVSPRENGGPTRPGGDIHVQDMRHGQDGQSLWPPVASAGRTDERASERGFGLGKSSQGRGGQSGPG